MPYLNTIIGSRIDWFATQHWKKYFELYDIFELHGIWCICFALDQLKNMIFCYIWDGTYNLIRKFCLPRVLLFSYIFSVLIMDVFLISLNFHGFSLFLSVYVIFTAFLSLYTFWLNRLQLSIINVEQSALNPTFCKYVFSAMFPYLLNNIGRTWISFFRRLLII